ncbi:nuclear transport factor 2 family protein [Sorangium sp. So ce1024]|uniref:nuclear transport factor 2 family protein n=1 Tax=unclassified Sorangium TaxID=2621164 RepID=UPI003EFBF35B
MRRLAVLMLVGSCLLGCASEDETASPSDPPTTEPPADAPALDRLIHALDVAERDELAAVLAEGAVFVDPDGRAEGLDAVAEELTARTAAAWERVAAIDEHHDVTRTRVRRGSAEELLYAMAGEDGRFRYVAVLPTALPPIGNEDATLTAYVQAWNEPDPAARTEHIERCWLEDGRYVDPSADVTGRAPLSAVIDGFHAGLPGSVIEVSSGVLELGELVHFTWSIRAPDGSVATEGMDVGMRGQGGQLALIAGFFGPLGPRDGAP